MAPLKLSPITPYCTLSNSFTLQPTTKTDAAKTTKQVNLFLIEASPTNTSDVFQQLSLLYSLQPLPHKEIIDCSYSSLQPYETKHMAVNNAVLRSEILKW